MLLLALSSCPRVLLPHLSGVAHLLSEHQLPFAHHCYSISHVWLFKTPWTIAHPAPLSSTISQSLLNLLSVDLMMPSNHLILCRPLLLLPSIFPSVRVFSNESALRIRWPKYWSFSFSISPSNQYSGLVSFCMDWFDLVLAIMEAGVLDI